MFTNCNKCAINDLYELPYNIFIEIQNPDQLVIGMAMTEKEDTLYQRNFSKDESSQSLHNLTYWHLHNYFGIGSGAAGSFFYKDKSIRYTNTTDLEKYIHFWNTDSFNKRAILNSFDGFNDFLRNVPCNVEVIDKDVEEFEFFMMNFRLRKGVSKSEYESRFEKNIDTRLGTGEGLFSQWIAEGKAEIMEEENDLFYRLTETGILYLNNFLENL